VIKRTTLLAFCAGNCLTTVHADPLPIRDLNPLLAGYELPSALPASRNLLQNAIDLSYAISNTSLDQRVGSEHSIADAELHRWQLTATRAINSRWSIQFELPYQSVSGGSLDRFIENFHSDFNFPNGNRATWPRNRLLINYSINDQSRYQLSTPQSGIGDLSMRAGWHFDLQTTHSSTLWFSAKVPTGNANNLTGSGSVDAALSLAAIQQFSDDVQSFEQFSVSWLGNGKRLSEEQKQSTWSGIIGLGWKLTHAVDVVTQLNAHSAVYDSQVRMLGAATQFTIGPRYHSAQWQSWISITEDVATDTAPDVQFQFNLSHQF
jgi:hypothetical protein